MQRMRVVVVSVAVVVSLVAAGCSSSSGGDGAGGSTPKGDGGRTSGALAKGHELTPRELTEALAKAGIGTVESPSATRPVVEVTNPGPLRLLQAQVDVMARQTADRSGTIGAQLDAAIAQPAEGAPFSRVVAAYVEAGTTKGAALSRRIMGEQPWAASPTVVFPDVVLALFADDVASEADAAPANAVSRGPVAVGRPAVRSDEATGVCSTLAGWVDGILQTVVDALKVDTSGGGVTGLLGDIWNTVVDLAVEAGAAVVKAITAPVVNLIKTGLAVAGTLSMAAALLRPWSVSAQQQPDPASYGVEPGSGNEVEVVATVDPGQSEPFSAGVIDCAKQAGVKLPDPTSAKDSKIEWTPQGIDAVGTGISSDDTIGADNTAKLRFTTKTESAKAASKGDPVPHAIAVTVKVERTQIKDLQSVLQTLLTGALPGPAGTIATAIFGVISQPIFDELASLLGTANAGSGTVISHTEPDEPDATSTSTPKDECAGLAKGAIPDGTWTGPIEIGVGGQTTGTSGTIHSTGSGQMTMTVVKGKVVSGTWSLTMSSSGTIETDGSTATITSMHGAIDGKVDGPATSPHQSGAFTLDGSISVSVQGFNTDVPIDESGSTETTMTVEQSSCSEVSGTFIPSFNENAGGYAVFDGIARWSGKAA